MNIIETQNLSRKFGDFYAVRSVNLSVQQGEIIGLLGPNGAGKSTLLRMLCGLLKPSSGSASVAHFDVDHQSEQIKKSIGYMGQSFSLFDDLTPLENMEFFGSIYGMKRHEIHNEGKKWLQLLNLQQHSSLLVRSLPAGRRHTLAFAVAMLHRPKIVFLDEPTSGLDPAARRELWKHISQAAAHGTTWMVSTHYMDEAMYCNRIAHMDGGEVRMADKNKQKLR